MSVITKCTSCGRELRAKDQYAGHRTRCPDCGTINLLPDQPDGAGRDSTQAAGEAPEGACPLCGQDFHANRDWVIDTKGQYFHRCCYEAARLRQQGQKDSPPPAQSAPRSQRKDKRQPAASSRPQPQGALPSPAPNPSQSASAPADDFWNELGAPLDSTDALWNADLFAVGDAVPGGDGSGFAAGSALPPVASRSKLDRNIKVLIGVGAAVPVLLIIAIVISILTRSERPVPSVAAADPAAERSEPEQSDIPAAFSPGSPAGSPPGPPVGFQPGPRAGYPSGPPAGSEPGPPPGSPHGPATSPRSVPPPVPWHPSHSVEPARSAPPTGANPADLAVALGGALGLLAAYIAIWLVIAAATLRTACGLCSVPAPSFGKAVLISVIAAMAMPLLMFVSTTMPVFGPDMIPLTLALAMAPVLTGVGFIYSKLVPTTFGKGVLIYVVQVLFTIAVMFVLALALVAVILLYAAVKS